MTRAIIPEARSFVPIYTERGHGREVHGPGVGDIPATADHARSKAEKQASIYPAQSALAFCSYSAAISVKVSAVCWSQTEMARRRHLRACERRNSACRMSVTSTNMFTAPRRWPAVSKIGVG